MMRNVRFHAWMGGLVTALTFAVGCSSGEDLPDGGPGPQPDAAAVADSGVRDLCPVPANGPVCNFASECQDDRPAPMRCDFCPLANDAICKLGRCEVPGRIEIAQTIEFFVTANDLEADLASFARLAVTTETTGGNTISCDDVIAESLAWSEQCYNVIDSRFNQRGTLVGGAFKLLFSQIPGGQSTLLIVYGFDQQDAMGDPIGVACVEVDVPEAGSTGTTMMVGAEMQSLR